MLKSKQNVINPLPLRKETMLDDLKLSRVRLWWIWWTLIDSLNAAGKKHNPEGWQGVLYGEPWRIWSDIAKCYWRLQIYRQTYSWKKGIKSTYQLFNQQFIAFINLNTHYLVDVFSSNTNNVFDPCFKKRGICQALLWAKLVFSWILKVKILPSINYGYFLLLFMTIFQPLFKDVVCDIF